MSAPARNDGNELPTERTPVADQKAATRQRILAAARKVFLRTGFVDANLNEVAALAGVGKGTLYRHFEHKGDLYLAMLSEHGDSFAREIAGAFDPGATALEQLEQVAAFYLDFWQRHPEHFQIIWAVQNRELIGPLSPELVASLGVVFEAPLKLIEGLIRKGMAEGSVRPVDPWNSASALALGANAIIGQIVRGTDQVVERDLVAVYAQLKDIVIAGLAAHPPARDEG